MDILIRQETEQDFESIFELLSKTFGQDNEAVLVKLLRKSTTFIPELFLVATTNNLILGHIVFTQIIIQNPQEQFTSLALAPIAVLPEFQKKGIGGKLIQASLQKAKKCGFTSVIVLGHERYYPQFGFEPANKWKIQAPFPVPDTVFMGIELVKDALKTVSGVVQYPEEFDSVS